MKTQYSSNSLYVGKKHLKKYYGDIPGVRTFRISKIDLDLEDDEELGAYYCQINYVINDCKIHVYKEISEHMYLNFILYTNDQFEEVEDWNTEDSLVRDFLKLFDVKGLIDDYILL